MKRAFCLLFALSLLILAGFGSAGAPAAKAAAPQPAAAALSAAPAPLVTISENLITVRDDGTGENSDKNGMKKTVVLTNRNIGYTGECGPLVYEI